MYGQKYLTRHTYVYVCMYVCVFVYRVRNLKRAIRITPNFGDKKK